MKNFTFFLKLPFCLFFSLLFLGSTMAQSSNAPCNTYSPLISATFPGVAVTSSQIAGSDVFTPKANLIDANLNNFASNNVLLSVGFPQYIEVQDGNATGAQVFPGGSYAGFVVDNNTINILNSITVSTYLNGVPRESFTGSSLATIAAFSGATRIGSLTTLSFDKVRLTVNGVVAIGAVNVFYAEVVRFCAGAALACNAITPLTMPAYPVVIDPANTGISGLVCALCAVNNPENVIDNNPANFAQITITAGAGVTASGSLAVSDQITTYAAGTYAGFDVETASLANVNVLGNVTITLLNNGAVVQTGTGSSQIVTAGTSLLSGTPRSIIGIVSNVPFDEVKITLANTASLDIGSTKIYSAVFEKGCAGTIGCRSTYFLNSPAYPVVIEGSRTGVNTVACVACTVTNTQNVITASNLDFGTISLTAGAFASGSISVRDLSTIYPAGTTTGFTVKDPNNFIQATLFNSITITTYLNGVQQESKTGTQLLSVSAVVVFINPANGVFNVGFTANLPWNEVRITYSNVAGALTFLDVYSAFVDTRNVPYGTPGFACNYTNPDVNVTYVNVTVAGNVSTNDKVQAGTTYGSPTLPTGVTNPSATLPIINANGSYTFTPNATGVYQFYVPVCLGSVCKNELLTITVLSPTSGANNAPVANTDIALTKINTAVIIKSLANDKPGKPGSALVPTSVVLTDLNGATAGNTTAGGTATVNPVNGDVSYTPPTGFIGIDTIKYTVCDNQPTPMCASAYQIVTVIPSSAASNTAAADDYVTTPPNVAVSGNVSTNDIDSDGGAEVVTTQNITNAQGTLVLNSDGTFTFTPVSGVYGPVDFPYTTCDASALTVCSNATLHILVQTPAVVPVVLSGFNAVIKDCNTFLSWRAETESNLKNYTVQYSLDGSKYADAVIITGTGSGSIYNAVHTAAQGKVFYRIKSTDLDGKIQYSKIIILNVTCGNNSVLIYPNPVSDFLNINIAASQNGNTGASLYDATGRKVSDKILRSGINQMDVSKLSRGTYNLCLRSSAGIENIRIIVK